MRMADAVLLVAMVGWLGLLDIQILAQSSDFSGTWRLDIEASELPQIPGRGGGRGGGGGRATAGPGGGPASLAVTQTDATLVISQAGRDGQSRTITYQLDGSESTNAGPRGGDLTTTSGWDGATLVTEGAQEISTQRGTFTIELVEHRSVSDDGQTMTVKTTRMTPRGNRVVSLVYRKATS